MTKYPNPNEARNPNDEFGTPVRTSSFVIPSCFRLRYATARQVGISPVTPKRLREGGSFVINKTPGHLHGI